jgi:hypothetical protein
LSLDKYVFVALITIDNNVRLLFFGVGCVFITMIFSDMLMTSFGAREIDKKISTFLEHPHSITTGTLLVSVECWAKTENSLIDMKMKLSPD